jgi:hypothetical protein
MVHSAARNTLFGLAAGALCAVAAGALIGAGRPGISRAGPSAAGTSAPAPGVSIRQRELSVPQPRAPASHEIIRDGSPAPMPRTDFNGAPMRAGQLAAPPRQPGIMRDPNFAQRLAAQRAQEHSDRFFWHRFGGVPYAHRFHNGVDWYGFYHGNDFFWTRYYGGFWWWFDPVFARWVYWYNDYWWWPGPGGALYVYMDNNYYPYDSVEEQVTVKRPQMEQPPMATPPPANEGQAYRSPDNSRLVQIMGSRGEAFLYDSSGKEPEFLKYLGKDAKEAGFTKDESGKKSIILLTYRDGGFALFDLDGNPLDIPKPRKKK